MVDIGNINPLKPIRPGRLFKPSDQAGKQQSKQDQNNKKNKQKKKGGSSPGIDEYA